MLSRLLASAPDALVAPDSVLAPLGRPALDVHALDAVVFLFGLAVAIALWTLRVWREHLARVTRRIDSSAALIDLAMLEQLGVAARADLEAMSARERRFMLEVLAPSLRARRGSGSAERPRRPVGVPPAEPRTVTFHCPACGAQSVCGLAAPLVVTACQGCRRRVTLRSEGSRVVVDADDGGEREEGA